MTQVSLNVPQWAWLSVTALLCFMVGLYLGTWADYMRSERADHRDD